MINFKKIAAPGFALLLSCAVWGQPVSADVIMEPIENEFYSMYGNKCEYINWRSYTVLKDCDSYANPKSQKAVFSFKKGDVINVGFSYTDENDTVWGCYMDPEKEPKCGWIRMDNIEVLYDHYSFYEEHNEEFEKYNMELEGFTPEKQVVMWTYPGSETINMIVKAEDWFTDEDYFLTVHENADYTWTDKNGDKWIFFGYGFDSWMYLPNPESEGEGVLKKTDDMPDNAFSEALDSLNSVEATVDAIDAASDDNPVTGYASDFALPAALSALTAVISGGMIFLIKKK